MILSGGGGTRLWPLSRSERPKQFLPLVDGQSLFAQTLGRVSDPALFLDPIIAGNEEHRFLIAEVCAAQTIERPAILLEPIGRDTAAALCLAALVAKPEDILLFMPSDHLIHDQPAFIDMIKKGKTLAEAGRIVCFGMAPDHPATGFGYVEEGEALTGLPGHEVARFREKPDEATAQQLIETGINYWNSGIFMARARDFLDEMDRHTPDILAQTKAAYDTRMMDLAFLKFDQSAFEAIRAESIDYALMEKTDRLALVPASIGWSDLGSFTQLFDQSKPDADGNRLVGGETLLEDCSGISIHGGHRLVAGLGLRDLIIVDSEDALLVADRGADQKIKKLVNRLKDGKNPLLHQHATIFRPWGTFRSLAMGTGFQVKELMVHPGKRLSLQKHFKRAEHWIVVAGRAFVTRDDDQFFVSENESVYLPLGCVHRLENKEDTPLIIIEVQSGSYLGEDDIVRLEDDFKRSNIE